MSKTAQQSKSQAQSQVAIAACTAIIGNGAEIQLTPAGVFRGIDGRPHNAPHWYIDADVAGVLIEAASGRVNSYVIDYDHQTLRAKENGQKAPAAGWFKKLEWREGVGLFGTGVEWTAAAQAEIDAGEFKYISPVLSYDKGTGNITGILMAALTNYAAIDGMDEANLAAACAQINLSHTAALTQELSPMEPLLEQLRWLLNLPVASTAEDILANLNKLADMIKAAGSTEGVAAASCDLIALINDQRTAIADLSANPTEPDPTKFVDIGTYQALQQQVAALSASANAANVDEIIATALKENRLLPSGEAWARKVGAQDIAALAALLADAPVIPALAGTQTRSISTPAVGTLSDSEAALCAALGCNADEFLATKKTEQAV